MSSSSSSSAGSGSSSDSDDNPPSPGIEKKRLRKITANSQDLEQKNAPDEGDTKSDVDKETKMENSAADVDDADEIREPRSRRAAVIQRDPRAEARARGRTTEVTVDPITMRTGGAYIPPARLRAMQAEIKDKSSAEYQRIVWNALKKSINGMVNKVNISNIQNIVLELFQENLVRGRGLLVRSVMKAQMASQTFTHVYAALMAIINTKFPQNGELLLKRLVLQFRRSYRRNDKATCLGVTKFIAHLVNQHVAHEVVALEILTLLLEKPTDDSVECCITFLKECGHFLSEISPRGIHAIFERMRNVLHEGTLDKRTQYMIEVMYAVRKDGFKDYPRVTEGLDLVEDDDQITHLVSLDEDLLGEQTLDVFKFDPKFEENEEKYKEIRAEILGDGSDDDSDDDDDDDEDEDEDEDDGDDAEGGASKGEQSGDMQITDMTETGLKILRRTIYLTIMSSASYEECAHKLLKMTLKPGYELELANMVIECCTQERSYIKFYGLLGARFCEIQREYQDAFCQCFLDQYQTVHRLETNKLRQMAKFFAHLFFTDAVPWNVLETIRLNENDTTSSSRIFIKELMLQMSEYMGVAAMVKRFTDPYMQQCFSGIFPKDTPKNTRFAINFFTSIGLGGLTDDLREHLKAAPKMIMAQRQANMVSDSETDDSDSDSDSSSSGSSSSNSSSGSSSGSDSSSDSSDSSDSSSGSESDASSGSRHVASHAQHRAGGARRDRSPGRAGNGDAADDRPAELKMTGEEAYAARARLSGRGGRGQSGDAHGQNDRRAGSRDPGRGDRSRDQRDERQQRPTHSRSPRDRRQVSPRDRRRDKRSASPRDRRDKRSASPRDRRDKRSASPRDRRDKRSASPRDRRDKRSASPRDRRDKRSASPRDRRNKRSASPRVRRRDGRSASPVDQIDDGHADAKDADGRGQEARLRARLEAKQRAGRRQGDDGESGYRGDDDEDTARDRTRPRQQRRRRTRSPDERERKTRRRDD